MNQAVLLVGSGPMAVDYAKVLKSMEREIITVGRGENSARKFEEDTGEKVFIGGIEKWLNSVKEYPKQAIVAVSENTLGIVTRQLIQAGIKSILVEKPGGLDHNDINQVYKESKLHDAHVYIGYNRRFYTSVIKAEEMITEDGGVASFNFEFTEWSHAIKDLQKDKNIKEEWFLANSTHVIDLAFYLGGRPKEMSSYISGGLDWHPAASIYAGAGVSELGALFSYQANWEAPGRWGLEVLTRKHRYIFRPLEKLQIQNIGSVAIEEVNINNELDIKFKPGVYKEVEAFLDGNKTQLPSIEDQIEMLEFYKMIRKS